METRLKSNTRNSSISGERTADSTFSSVLEWATWMRRPAGMDKRPVARLIIHPSVWLQTDDSVRIRVKIENRPENGGEKK